MAILAISPKSSISPCKKLHENCENSEKSHFSQCIFLKLEMVLEIVIDEMDGEAHDVEIRTVHSGTSDVTDPFLHSIGSGFIERTVMRDIIVDLSVG